MIRNLRILFLASLALTAFGALNAVGAHAAEERFHCEVVKCRLTLRTDGTGTTAHHVFVLKNSVGESISFTCESLRGDATTEEKTVEDITLTGIAYDECKSVLGKATVEMNGCTYTFTSKGGADKAKVSIICPKNSRIEIRNGTCTVRVPGSLEGKEGEVNAKLPGIGYHNLPEPSGKEEVTVTANVANILSEPEGECGFDITKKPISSTYTTGNTIVTADEDGTEKMVKVWWE